MLWPFVDPWKLRHTRPSLRGLRTLDGAVGALQQALGDASAEREVGQAVTAAPGFAQAEGAVAAS